MDLVENHIQFKLLQAMLKLWFCYQTTTAVSKSVNLPDHRCLLQQSEIPQCSESQLVSIITGFH